MADIERCCICEKELNPTRKTRLSVNYDNAEGRPIPLNAEPAHGQWGFLPIGPGCAKHVGVEVMKDSYEQHI